MQRILYTVLWLLMSATLLVASVPNDSHAATPTYYAPKITVTVVRATVLPGRTQALTIEIDELPDRRTALVLVVDYPNGETKRSLHYVESGRGAIEWQIPDDTGSGEATFRLIADGCSCGEKNTIPRQPAIDGSVEGQFVIGMVP